VTLATGHRGFEPRGRGGLDGVVAAGHERRSIEAADPAKEQFRVEFGVRK
jgi:hypothetical protein